jgi:DNA-binding NarL/FixJ family response regulator
MSSLQSGTMISVCIIEDDPEIRDQLARILSRAAGFSCSGTYRDCESALAQLGRHRPDVVLMDIGLPGMSGIQGVAAVKERWPEIEVVMLTVHDEDGLIFESLRGGASGFLLKGISPEKLLCALREVHEGGAPMSMSIARRVAESFHVKPPAEPLTGREQEVLNRLRDGQSYQTIADALFIARSTVKFHIKNIYRKLHITNKYEAMRQ